MQDLEYCSVCDSKTGRAGESDDSIFVDGIGPLCEECQEKSIYEKKNKSDLEIFLDQHYMGLVFCGWYSKACQSDDLHARIWGRASIHAMSFLEIKAHEDIVFVMQMIGLTMEQ